MKQTVGTHGGDGIIANMFDVRLVLLNLVDFFLVNIETENLNILLAKGARQRQPDISKPDNADNGLLGFNFFQSAQFPIPSQCSAKD